MRYPISLILLAAGFLCSCGESPTVPSSQPFAGPPPVAGGKTSFTKLDPAATGVDFVNPVVAGHPMRRLFSSSMVVGGVAVGDIDGDEKPDLFFTNGPNKNALYRQTGDFTWEDITAKAGVDGGDNWGVGTTMVDIDNDGDLDIYVCNHDTPNELYLNDGAGAFTESAASFGLGLVEASHTPAFCDFDRDGDLDLYLLTNKYYNPDGKLPENLNVVGTKPGRVRGSEDIFIKPEYEKYVVIKEVRPKPTGGFQVDWEEDGRPDYFFRNEGNGSFKDVTKEVGISSVGYGLSATWWDYNEDGWTDIYVANDFDGADHFYKNNGDGTFSNIIEDSVPHTSWFSMGADFGDINADGALDFLVADMSGSNHYKQKTAMGAMGASAEFLATAEPRQYMRNALYLGSGVNNYFQEAAYLSGLSDTDWTWTVKITDLDNDGLDDVYFTNGMSKNFNASDGDALDIRVGETQWDRHVRAKTPPLNEQNLVYRNGGNLEMEDVSKEWGLDDVGMSFGSIHSDLDRDGDLDLVVVNLDRPVTIYRNDSESGNSVLFRLKGKKSNPAGIGARIDLVAGGREQKRQISIMRGYMGSHEAVAHFGLGDATTIEKATIHWPSGIVQTVENLPANQFHVIEESGSPAEKSGRAERQQFLAVTSLNKVVHQENEFDDFIRQPLLPNKMSQFGPGVAVGDVDGDGDEDFVMSGARGFATTLCLNDGKGNFTSRPATPDVAYEDQGLLLFEADGDGDLDLYVVSGGSEADPGTSGLQDRLYMNDGKGRFVLNKTGLPDMSFSGGTLVAGDVDRDGDLDLFVGGRQVPGAYPLGPESRLLRNEGGRFVDAADPALAQLGMVTGAVFSDANNDGWVDLVVCSEWGPVRVLANQNGRFSPLPQVDPPTGWWHGLSSGDLNQDGHVDFVATNTGLNTKYHASSKTPALGYYGDFEGTGKKNFVEAEFEDGKLFPIRGRSCSTLAIPSLANKINSFHQFALLELPEIYTAQSLEESERFAATHLESGVFYNDGKGGLQFEKLPAMVQLAPGFGSVVTEVNGDGHPDVYIVQNFYGPQVETGHMDGGMSILLQGDGQGGFQEIAPRKTGLVVRKDAKGLGAMDLNNDNQVDFVVGRNKDSVLGFRNRATPEGKSVKVRLEGPGGNPTAVGARVSVVLSDDSRQTAEVQAGAGYFSQSTASLFFGLGQGNTIKEIAVRWPNGQEKTYAGEAVSGQAIVLKP